MTNRSLVAVHARTKLKVYLVK